MTSDLPLHKILKFSIGTHEISIAQIADPESLFDELLTKDDDDEDVEDERIPYWADLWPSAIALSEYLSEHPELVKGKKIIELGCGISMPGIMAAKLGGEVLLTDYLQKALDFAGYNWKLNFKSTANTQLLDWRTPVEIDPVDVVLASDVAYESRSFKPLLKTLKSLVKKNGIVLISEPNRHFTKIFFRELKEAGFEISETQKNIVKDGIGYKISIYLLKL